MTKHDIVEKLQKAERFTDVSPRQFEIALVQAYDEKDAGRVVEIFNAYKNWELKYSDGSRTSDETIQLSKSNLDLICKIADTRIKRGDGHDDDSALFETVKFPSPVIGLVRQFYRTAIGYNPIDPKLN